MNNNLLLSDKTTLLTKSYKTGLRPKISSHYLEQFLNFAGVFS